MPLRRSPSAAHRSGAPPNAGFFVVTRSCVARLCAMLFALTAITTRVATAQTAAPPAVDIGFGRGLTVRSADDLTSMNIRARIQVRGTASDNTDDDHPATTEAMIRRMRLLFQGNANGPALTYYVQLSFSTLDMEADLRSPLRDAYVTWTPRRDVAVRVGQMKVPFSRQRVVSSSALQMVDRSPVVSELNLDRDVGVQVFSKDWFGIGKLGYAVGLFGGEGRNRVGREAGALYTARVEAWPLGAFDDYVESDLRRASNLRVAVGANLAYNQNTQRPRSTIGEPYPAGDFDYAHAGLDATAKIRGCSIGSELLYRRANVDRQDVQVNGTPLTIVSRSGWGAYVQGGCLVTQQVEVSGRFSRLMPLAGRAQAFATTNEVAFGVGHYARDHNLKVQNDYSYETATGRRNHQVRSQLQLFF